MPCIGHFNSYAQRRDARSAPFWGGDGCSTLAGSVLLQPCPVLSCAVETPPILRCPLSSSRTSLPPQCTSRICILSLHPTSLSHFTVSTPCLTLYTRRGVLAIAPPSLFNPAWQLACTSPGSPTQSAKRALLIGPTGTCPPRCNLLSPHSCHTPVLLTILPPYSCHTPTTLPLHLPLPWQVPNRY